MRKFYFLLIATLIFLPLVSLKAQSVDILWQGDTYTSPFYKGKTLWSKQSTITLVAMPQGLGASSGLNFKWKKNGTVLGGSSGVGKSTLTYTDTILSKPQTIEVEIVSGSTVRAKSSIVIVPTNPLAMVYENDPLLGFMFHRETSGAYKLDGREVTFGAFPFFFSTPSRLSDDLTYDWRNNAGGRESMSSVTYRTPDDSEGAAEVSVRITSPENVTQDSKKSFKIEFDNRVNNL